MVNRDAQKNLLGNHPERIDKWIHECLVGRVTTNMNGEKKVVLTMYPLKDWPDKKEK